MGISTFTVVHRNPTSEERRMSVLAQRNSSAWKPHQDEILMEARARGMNWGPIQQQNFPFKTPNACRKRHERLMDRQHNESWDQDMLENMAKEYLSIRKDMWSILAAQIGEKWEVVEAKCMEKGLRNLQSAGRSARRRERLNASSSDENGSPSDEHGSPTLTSATEDSSEPETTARHSVRSILNP